MEKVKKKRAPVDRKPYFLALYLGKETRADLDEWAASGNVSPYRLARALIEYCLERQERNDAFRSWATDRAGVMRPTVGKADRTPREVVRDGRAPE